MYRKTTHAVEFVSDASNISSECQAVKAGNELATIRSSWSKYLQSTSESFSDMIILESQSVTLICQVPTHPVVQLSALGRQPGTLWSMNGSGIFVPMELPQGFMPQCLGSCLCPQTHSSSAGISSSIYLINDTLISVVSFPLKTSLMKCASVCIWTISNAPLSTPQKIFEYQSSSWALPSSGNSTKSARGFSSKINENCLLSLVQLVTTGVMLRNILKPTLR